MAVRKVTIAGKEYTLEEIEKLAADGRLIVTSPKPGRPTPAPKPQPPVTARALKEAREMGVQRSKR